MNTAIPKPVSNTRIVLPFFVSLQPFSDTNCTDLWPHGNAGAKRNCWPNRANRRRRKTEMIMHLTSTTTQLEGDCVGDESRAAASAPGVFDDTTASCSIIVVCLSCYLSIFFLLFTHSNTAFDWCGTVLQYSNIYLKKRRCHGYRVPISFRHILSKITKYI